VKLSATAGKDFVRVSLVSHIPYDSIMRRIENIVEREGQFDYPKVRGEVSSIFGNCANDEFADFLSQLLQLDQSEVFELRWTVNLGK
jgi:hypothetical protein